MQKEVTIEQYNKKMDKIIKKNKKKPISETLIELIEEAAKYKIVGKNGKL